MFSDLPEIFRGGNIHRVVPITTSLPQYLISLERYSHLKFWKFPSYLKQKGVTDFLLLYLKAKKFR